MKPAAILDTSALIALYTVGLLPHLNLLFKEVRLPRKVREEFVRRPRQPEEADKRLNLLLQLPEVMPWLVACNDYESKKIESWKKKHDLLHDGEAEVFAQCNALGNRHTLVFDETIARTLAKQEKLDLVGTAKLLAMLSLLGFCDYSKTVRDLRQRIHFKLSDRWAVEAMREAAKDLGVPAMAFK